MLARIASAVFVHTKGLGVSFVTSMNGNPGRISGAWLFKGIRVPVKALLENLDAGVRLHEFLDGCPGVTREQAEAVLQHAELSLAAA